MANVSGTAAPCGDSSLEGEATINAILALVIALTALIGALGALIKMMLSTARSSLRKIEELHAIMTPATSTSGATISPVASNEDAADSGTREPDKTK
jgi:hypothetical protein